MKFFGIQDARVHKVCAKFCYQMTCEELSQKNQNSVFFTSFFLRQILFFSPRAPTMSKHNKILHTPSTPKHLGCQKNSYFFEFFCYFFEFTVHTRTYLLFFLRHELLECPDNMKICTHLANLSTFDPTKFQIFLTFFAIFSRWSKLFDQTVTAQKGISIRATNGRGANLSTH